jgi:hypothetical protein
VSVTLANGGDQEQRKFTDIYPTPPEVTRALLRRLRIFLLKSQYWHSKRREKLFQRIRPAQVFPLTWRPDFHFGAKGSAPTMEVLWTVWRSPYRSKFTKYEPLSK